MNIRRGWIEPGLNTLRFFIFGAGNKSLMEALRADNLRRAPRDAIHEFVGGNRAHNEEPAWAGWGKRLGLMINTVNCRKMMGAVLYFRADADFHLLDIDFDDPYPQPIPGF